MQTRRIINRFKDLLHNAITEVYPEWQLYNYIVFSHSHQGAPSLFKLMKLKQTLNSHGHVHVVCVFGVEIFDIQSNQIQNAVMICTVQAQTEPYLWLFASEMILTPISLLVTAHVCFASKSAVDKRLLISDQTVLHESITKLQTELQQLKAEVEQLKQSKSGQYSLTHLLGLHSYFGGGGGGVNFRGFIKFTVDTWYTDIREFVDKSPRQRNLIHENWWSTNPTELKVLKPL